MGSNSVSFVLPKLPQRKELKSRVEDSFLLKSIPRDWRPIKYVKQKRIKIFALVIFSVLLAEASLVS